MWTLTYALEYLPQMLGFALARLCAFNGVTTFMLGRFFNLLFYVACLHIAIRLAPRFKVTFGQCCASSSATGIRRRSGWRL